MEIVYTGDSLDKVRTLMPQFCVFPAVERFGNFVSKVQLRVPTSFDYTRPSNCPFPNEDL